MTDFSLKNIPSDQYTRLRKMAAARETTVTKILLDFIAELVGDRDDMILAYLPVSEIGDMNLDDDCPQCDQPLGKVGRVRIGMRANGLDPVVVCSGCSQEHSGGENG